MFNAVRCLSFILSGPRIPRVFAAGYDSLTVGACLGEKPAFFGIFLRTERAIGAVTTARRPLTARLERDGALPESSARHRGDWLAPRRCGTGLPARLSQTRADSTSTRATVIAARSIANSAAGAAAAAPYLHQLDRKLVVHRR